MNITEETKIKDLIPEGWELDYQVSDIINGVNSQIHIGIKKKLVKDWNWYIEEYFNKKYSISNLDSWLDKESINSIKHNLINFHSIPFEIKIGLLKFICDDLKVNWIYFLAWREDKTINMVGKIKSICPTEFIKSIFE